MINLLPPELKTQIAYSKRNAILVRYVRLGVIVAVILGGAFGGASVYLQQRLDNAQKQTVQKQLTLKGYSSVQAEVKSANDRINALKTVQKSQAKFSAVLQDIAAHTPAGVFINSVTLTGNDKNPVTIAATANSYNDAVALREALASSSRIAAADIASVGQDQGGKFSVQVTVAYKPGQSR